MSTKTLTCACCGSETPPLMQSAMQDTGTGLCARCADWIEARQGADYLREHYGVRGQHIPSKETN